MQRLSACARSDVLDHKAGDSQQPHLAPTLVVAI
jgi:hypothetical protein